MNYQSYYIDCTDDIPTAVWESVLTTHLTATEKKTVMGYVFRKDQERSLLSLLLQKYVIKRFLSAANTNPNPSSLSRDLDEPRLEEVEEEEEGGKSPEISFSIARTRENKPYLSLTSIEIIDLMKKSGGYFNYNVSHHGNFVGIVSHTSVLVGMDIVDITTRAPWVSGLKEYIEIYRKQLSDSEVASIFAKPTELESYTHFYLLWSLKEAYVKAIGVGIGINLKEVEFEVMYTPSETTTIGEELQTSSISGYAKLCLQGIPNFNWEFQFMNLDSAHLLTVAKGPPAAALPTFAAVAWPQVPSHCVPLQENSSCSVFKVDTTTLQQPTLLTLDQLVVI
jgi:4'-phosphopantetheinyl transferase